MARGHAVPARVVLTFLAVGGAGYVTDVAAFNWLRDQPSVGGTDPIGAKIAAVAVAMVVTYLGNRMLTWRGLGSSSRRRELGLFAVFNLAGLMISVLALALSHDVLGLTSRLADNISGNVVGVGLGTVFRYWTYQRFVFAGGTRVDAATTPGPPDERVVGAGTSAVPVVQAATADRSG